jgi:hypothetical protein
MKTRRASSLVEIVVVLTALSAILTTSAVLLHRAMHLHGKSRSFLSAQRSALRLSDQFRQDTHRAEAVLEDDPLDKGAIRLRLAEAQIVEYRHEAGVVRRALSREDKLISREEYAFPPESKVRISPSDPPGRLTLSISCDPTVDDSPDLKSFAVPVCLHVEARLGREARFRETQVEKEASP